MKIDKEGLIGPKKLTMLKNEVENNEPFFLSLNENKSHLR